MLEFERQSKLSVDTMPGTKILIQNPKFIESYIAINNSVRVLGSGSTIYPGSIRFQIQSRSCVSSIRLYSEIDKMEPGKGGEVDKMIEKWLVERDATSDQFRARSFEQGGPPPFIPFEKRNKKGKYSDQEEDLSKR